jgi:hypothetical protein
MIESNYLCFRVWCWDLDPEQVDQMGFTVQAAGGWISPGRVYVDFWLPKNTADFFVIKYADFVERYAALDYV